MKTLYIFVDETGDFGFNKNSSDLYGISFVFHDGSNNVNDKIKYLNKKLEHIGYTKMIHTVDLISKRGAYENFDIITRKKIFNALYQFARKLPVHYHSVIINKKYLNSKLQLRYEIIALLNEFLYNNYKYFNKYNKIILYYDNGQKSLGIILDEFFKKFMIYEHIENFCHKEKKLFQVADMLTYVDKYDYKYKNKISFSKSEIYFFEIFDMKNILKGLSHKRFK